MVIVAVLERPRVTHPAAALIALAAGAFVYVTSESMPIGLLPQIRDGLHVSDGQVGLLVTLYALVAAITALPFTAWATRLPRRGLLAFLIALFAVSQFAAAVAPGYWWLVGARVLCALGHGVFWSIVAPVAARLVPDRPGRATSAVFVGTSLALVLGSPISTLLGQLLGWRVAFVVVGVAGVLTVLAVWLLVPKLAGQTTATPLRGLGPALFGSRPLLALYAVTLLVVIGHYAAYTYLAPIVQVFGGITGHGYSALLFGYGAAGLVAVAVASGVLDRYPGRSFLLPVGAIAVALAALAAGLGPVGTVITVVLWGGAFTVLPTVLQTSVLRVAPAHADTASAVYVVAFQIGIGGGALIGGVLADAGHIGTLPVLAAAAAALVVVIGWRSRTLFPLRAVASARFSTHD